MRLPFGHVWCCNRSLRQITFENCYFGDLIRAGMLWGDENEKVTCTYKNCTIACREGCGKEPLFVAANYEKIVFEDCRLEGYEDPHILSATEGNVELIRSTPIRVQRLPGRSALRPILGERAFWTIRILWRASVSAARKTVLGRFIRPSPKRLDPSHKSKKTGFLISLFFVFSWFFEKTVEIYKLSDIFYCILLFGMATKYSEILLAIKFREKNEYGAFMGGQRNFKCHVHTPFL
jgi:hypothetical protein